MHNANSTMKSNCDHSVMMTFQTIIPTKCFIIYIKVIKKLVTNDSLQILLIKLPSILIAR